MSNDDLGQFREVLFNVKPYEALLTLSGERLYLREISRGIDSTHSHATKLMKRLENYGLVKSEKVGRRKYYALTEDGEELVSNLENIESVFNPEADFGSDSNRDIEFQPVQ